MNTDYTLCPPHSSTGSVSGTWAFPVYLWLKISFSCHSFSCLWSVVFSEIPSNPNLHRLCYSWKLTRFVIFLLCLTPCPTESLRAFVKSRQIQCVFSKEPRRVSFRTWTGITRMVQKGYDQLWQPRGRWIMVKICFDGIWRWNFSYKQHSQLLCHWEYLRSEVSVEFYHWSQGGEYWIMMLLWPAQSHTGQQQIEILT